MPHSSLSTEQVQHYRQNGYLFPLRAMSGEMAAGYLRKVEAFESEYGGQSGEVLRQKSHVVLTWVNELIRLEPVLDAVESLIGPDILCWSTSFFIKNANDPHFVAWHQDAPYWGLDSNDIVSAWIALTPSNEMNGCLKVLGGSHKQVVQHEARFTKNNMLLQGQEIAVEVDETQATKLVLEPGQFSFHHPMIIHGSAPNSSSGRRIGFAVRYLKTSARQLRFDTDTATLVRGSDRFGHFIPEPTPASDMHPAAVGFLDDLLSKRYGGHFRYRKEKDAASLS
ncbi:MAG: phytanoyl-CoA dioxygenase family protein [Dongiaceae bacterium]